VVTCCLVSPILTDQTATQGVSSPEKFVLTIKSDLTGLLSSLCLFGLSGIGYAGNARLSRAWCRAVGVRHSPRASVIGAVLPDPIVVAQQSW